MVFYGNSLELSFAIICFWDEPFQDTVAFPAMIELAVFLKILTTAAEEASSLAALQLYKSQLSTRAKTFIDF